MIANVIYKKPEKQPRKKGSFKNFAELTQTDKNDQKTRVEPIISLCRPDRTKKIFEGTSKHNLNYEKQQQLKQTIETAQKNAIFRINENEPQSYIRCPIVIFTTTIISKPFSLQANNFADMDIDTMDNRKNMLCQMQVYTT